MELTTGERAFLEARLKKYREKNAFKDNLEKRIRESNRRREAVGNRFRQNLIRKAIEASGVNYDDIIDRQAKERAMAGEEMAKLKPEIEANVPAVTARHEKWIKNLRKRIPHPEKKNPVPDSIEIGELLDPAHMSFTSDVGTGNVESQGPGKNIFRWLWKHLLDSTSFGVAYGTFTFAFTPTVNGVLGVAMPVAYNGSMMGGIDSGCFEGGNFGLSSSESMIIDQMVPGAEDNSEEVDVGGLNIYKGIDAPVCSTHYDAYVIDQQDLVETTNHLLVIANHTVLITLTVQVVASFANGGIDVDFYTNGQGITVAGVIFGLTARV